MVRRCFTLIEMLVVIAIIGILAGLLSGPIMRSLRQGKIATCTNNLGQFRTMVSMYQNANDSKYPPWLSAADYGNNSEIFKCALDDSGGKQGSRPDWIADGTSNPQYAETNDMPENKMTDKDKGESPSGKWGTPFQAPTEKIEACSYLYEFNAAKCTWDASGYGLTGDYSWQQAKLAECKESSKKAFVPIVRCYQHNENKGDRALNDNDRTLNLRVSGAINNSTPKIWWETSD